MDYLQLSQDATNEIWSVILRQNFPSPGAKKRAIEREIRCAIETALGIPSTVDGYESGTDPLYEEPAPRPVQNPNACPDWCTCYKCTR
jgi:hypothetical protein